MLEAFRILLKPQRRPASGGHFQNDVLSRATKCLKGQTDLQHQGISCCQLFDPVFGIVYICLYIYINYISMFQSLYSLGEGVHSTAVEHKRYHWACETMTTSVKRAQHL
jgi:hypothetical protein